MERDLRPFDDGFGKGGRTVDPIQQDRYGRNLW